VDGSVQFDNIAVSPAASTLGATATLVPTATDTDRCTYCHSPASVGGVVGTVMVKANWGTGTFLVPCLTCHNAASAAWRYADGTGVRAPAKDAYFGITGHGRPTASGTYPVTANPPANYTTALQPRCSVCHLDTGAHISAVLGDADRLKAVVPDGLSYTLGISEVCLDCHKVGQSTPGSLGYDAIQEATVHSGGVTSKYNTAALAPAAFPAYGNAAAYAASPGYQCEACHDVHGTQRLAMVLNTLDGKIGGVSNPRTLPAGVFTSGTDIDLTDLDPSVLADNGVCDQCHAGANAPHPDTAHAGNHNQGAPGQSCVACHDHKKSFQ
jgi:predicted CxxxxCH...CXXCH cytochrome family protein